MLAVTRTKVALKKEIVDALNEFPMTTHGTATYVNCHYDTAKRRLEELEEDGVVVQDEEKWRINPKH